MEWRNHYLAMKKQLHISIYALIFLAIGLVSCKDASKEVNTQEPVQQSEENVVQSGITLLSPDDFRKRIDVVGDIQLLDVRTPQEVATGTIAGAMNIDIMNNDFEKKVSVLDISKPVFVYCKSGGRSRRASEVLQKAGFLEIYDLNGGITAWKSAGLETVR